uniref:Uncharacterized protein n=1 Tax=Denticeps clupeoides TaxID=299321 RepID=A0AAY4EZE4_9TELE
MPSTKVIKPNSLDIKTKIIEVKPRRTENPGSLQTKIIGKKRASSCSRCIQTNKCEKTSRSQTHAQASKCERKGKTVPAPPLKSREKQAEKKEQQATEKRVIFEIQSHKAFTVFPPNPKKRNEIQKNAEAELAALEDLRLSRAMGYISLTPGTVGGSLTLEEVRSKQQQEMQMKRRPKQVKRNHLETFPVLG